MFVQGGCGGAQDAHQQCSCLFNKYCTNTSYHGRYRRGFSYSIIKTKHDQIIRSAQGIPKLIIELLTQNHRMPAMLLQIGPLIQDTSYSATSLRLLAGTVSYIATRLSHLYRMLAILLPDEVTYTDCQLLCYQITLLTQDVSYFATRFFLHWKPQ